MLSIETLLTYSITALILNISPGPSNLYIIARSIAQGVRGGIIAAAGLAIGLLVHVLAAAFGLSAIFKYSPLIYTIVKLVGAGYLIYLGISCWRSEKASADSKHLSNTKSNMQIFKESVLVEVTNPKNCPFLPCPVTAICRT